MPPQADKTKLEPVEDTKLTAEQEGELNAFVGDLIEGPKPKTEAKEPKKAKDVEEPKEPETKKVEDPETKPKPARKTTPKEPAMTPAAIAEAVARGVAQATAKPADKTTDKTEDKPDPLAFLSPKDRRRLEILTQMEKDSPVDYKGVSDKFTAGCKAELEYQAKWESENPDETFDPEAEAHSEFYAKHDVKFDDDDYATAITRLETAKVRKEYEDKETARETARKSEARKLEAIPAMQQESNLTADEMLKEMGGEFAKVHKEGGAVDNDVVKKLFADDPSAEMVFKAAKYAQDVAAETYRLYNGLAEYDQNKPTAIQQEIIDYILEQEDSILNLDPKELLNKGKTFATYQNWLAMTPEQQAKHWYLGAREVNALRAVDIAKHTKAVVAAEEKRLEQWAAKKGMTKKEQSTADAEVKRLQESEAAEAARAAVETDDDKPVSPESSGGPGVSQRTTAKDHTPQSSDATLISEIIG